MISYISIAVIKHFTQGILETEERVFGAYCSRGTRPTPLRQALWQQVPGMVAGAADSSHLNLKQETEQAIWGW